MQKNLGRNNQLGLLVVSDAGSAAAVAAAAALPDFDKHQLPGWPRFVHDQIDFTALAGEIAFDQLQSALLYIRQRDVLGRLAALIRAAGQEGPENTHGAVFMSSGKDAVSVGRAV